MHLFFALCSQIVSKLYTYFQLIGKHKFSDEKISWLRLVRTKNIGPRTFWQLLKLFGSASAAIARLPELAKRGGDRNFSVPPLSEIERELEQIERFGGTLLLANMPEYPHLLRNIDDPPPLLTACGDVSLLKKKGVAIVGSRNPSAGGCIMAKEISDELAANDYLIVSGLARGIDAVAHETALPDGTAAVIAGGIDHIYPPQNAKLFHQLYQKGLLLTEQPFGSAPLAKHFPQRNRIISGISLATVVIEAAIRSGTLITARYALEQGREVFAVPGSPLDHRYHGTNQLIKSGAHLLESAQDVIEQLQRQAVSPQLDSLFDDSGQFQHTTHEPCSIEEKQLAIYRNLVAEKISFTPSKLEDIAKYSAAPIQIVNYLIVEMELSGKVERVFGNKVVLRQQ